MTWITSPTHGNGGGAMMRGGFNWVDEPRESDIICEKIFSIYPDVRTYLKWVEHGPEGNAQFTEYCRQELAFLEMYDDREVLRRHLRRQFSLVVTE